LFDRLTGTELDHVAGADDQAASGAAPVAGPLPGPLPQGPARRAVHWLLRRLPGEIREQLHRFLRAEAEAARALGATLTAVWRFVMGRFVRAPLHAGRRASRPADQVAGTPGREAPPAEATGAVFRRLATPGDVLLVLGSPWFRADYGEFVGTLKQRHGIRFALLVYDLIPHRHPEWCDPHLVRMFRAWFASVLPLADAIFAISRASADDVEAYSAEAGFPLSHPVQPIPIGAGFGEAGPACATEPPSPRLPLPGTYALIVSTIEPRKNHMLLFRVWRRLVAEMPRDRVPTLVWAGRVGWMVGDLMQQLANGGWLDGKIRLVEDPTDATIEDPAGLAAWEARVRREFRPVPWQESAAAILGNLGLSAAYPARPLLA
jgi:glycosyltransferase involved in cell wall biosynthesis